MNESELTNALVKDNRERGHDVGVEVPYNHYGDRGVVDLVVEMDRTVTAYEIKSEYAIKNVTGANEIIRQYNRQREYFGKGSTMRIPRNKRLHHRLLFAATPYTYEHVTDNWAMYSGVCEDWDDDYTMTSMIEFFHVDTIPQSLRLTKHGDVYDFNSNRRVAEAAGIEVENFVEYDSDGEYE